MKKLMLAVVAVGMFSGCAAGSMRTPVNGYLYNDAKVGEAATGNISKSKTGRACATSILGLVGTGDASILAAAADGKITKVSVVDAEVKSILGIWAEYCTVVYGD